MGNYAGREIKETKPGNQMTHDNDRDAAEFPLFTLNLVFMDGTQDEGGGSASYKRKMPALQHGNLLYFPYLHLFYSSKPSFNCILGFSRGFLVPSS